MEIYIIGLLALAAIIVGLFIFFECPGWAMLSLVATTAVWNYLSDGQVWSAIQQHPSLCLAIAMGYMTLGVVWSFVKWYLFLLNTRDKYQEYMSRNLPSAAKDYNIPLARDHKYQILTWMMYWPFSAILTLIDEPIRRAFIRIYTFLQGSYDRIAAHVYKNVPRPELPSDKLSKDEEDYLSKKKPWKYEKK